MKSVFIITSTTHVCHGHGDYGDETTLPTIGDYGSGGFHSAFTSRAKAEAYLHSIDSYDLEVTELIIRD